MDNADDLIAQGQGLGMLAPVDENTGRFRVVTPPEELVSMFERAYPPEPSANGQRASC